MTRKEQRKADFAICKRSLKLINDADKGHTLRSCACDVFELTTTYLYISLAAIVMNSIERGEDFRTLLLKAGIVTIAEVICWIISRMFRRRDNCHKFQLEQNLKQMLVKKITGMDYVRLEDNRTHQAFYKANQYMLGSHGITKLEMNFIFFVYGILQLVIGIIVIAPLAFAERTVTTGFTGFIQSVWGLLALIAVVTVLEIIKGTAVNRKSFEIENEARTGMTALKLYPLSEELERHVLHNYRSGKDIRLYGQQDLILSKINEVADTHCNMWKKACLRLIGPNAVFSGISIVTRVLMFAFAVYRCATGMLSAGDVIAFSLYFMQIQGGISNISDAYGWMKVCIPNCKYVFDFLDIPDEKYMGTIPTEKRTDNEYEFEFKHVWFKYPSCEDYTLKDINLKWKIGEKMALVGRNGCGKSTLVKLLCRLYDPTEGEITLNGIDIRKYNYADYMALFSVVFQDSHLFSFSMAENVAASTEYDAERVTECVRRAGLSERLETMSHGIDTCLYKDFDSEGVEISGGEEQKLCLARAIYKGAPFIVLDEPTAALDPISEHDIYTKFNSIVGTRTAIYISHRLSSCRFCDEITVMENGRIAERGSHETLLQKQGVYQKLWTAQAEYYKDTAGELYA